MKEETGLSLLALLASWRFNGLSELLALELAHVELVVDPLLLEQLVVGSALDDTAAVDDQHLIGVANRAQSVGDDEARSTLHEA